MKGWRVIEAPIATPGGNPSGLDAPPILLEHLAPFAQAESAARVAFDRAAPLERSARRTCEGLHRAVEETLARGERPLILGGECTLVAGSLSAAVDRFSSLALAFFDAHGDFNTVQTTPSGYLGGMCLAHACGLFVESLPWAAAAPFPGRNLCLIGGRELDPGEAENLDRVGASRIAPEASDAAQRIREFFRGKPIWAHIDLDVVDPSDMFAVSHPTPRGITLERLSELLGALSETGSLQGVEVCGYLPAKDPRRALPSRVAGALANILRE